MLVKLSYWSYVLVLNDSRFAGDDASWEILGSSIYSVTLERSIFNIVLLQLTCSFSPPSRCLPPYGLTTSNILRPNVVEGTAHSLQIQIDLPLLLCCAQRKPAFSKYEQTYIYASCLSIFPNETKILGL